MERALADYLTHAPVFIRTLPGEIVYWTSGAEELYGYTASEARGRVSHQLLNTIFPEPLREIERRLQEHGEWTGRLQHRGRHGQQIWTESNWRLRNAGPDEDAMIVESNTDITQRVQAEHHRDLLVRELDHRVKNTLAVVQGLARLTFGGADREHVQRFEQRLIALSEAHNLLLREHWEHADLKELISGITRSLDVSDRVHIQGPDATLQPNAAVSYALAFHELCTNALKHGALTAPSGRVDIVWEFLGPDRENIHLIWRELGGPRVLPPERKGFGSRLIQRAVSKELGTPVELRFEPTGLVCEFDGPIQKTPAFVDEVATPP